ncbi:MAG TPA: RNA polymerase sigma factor [Syntrophomonadaceae bacterium]|nr:RNA polymerase sigma factor [Syntrophomonadaceae bacterium]
MEKKLTDQDLVQRTLSGELSAFEKLVLRYQQAVFNIVFRILRNKEEAEDIVQESFIKCYQSLNKYDQRRPFTPWLYRIASNLALTRVRQIKRQRLIPWDTASSQLPDQNTVNPAASLEAVEIKQEVSSYLAKLKPLDQLVIILRYYQDLNYDEIAYILDTTRNNVEVRLCRARQRLRQILKNQGVTKCSTAVKQKNSLISI